MPETGVFATLELIIHPKANKSKVFFGKSFGKIKNVLRAERNTDGKESAFNGRTMRKTESLLL